jgi:hypothetical protein
MWPLRFFLIRLLPCYVVQTKSGGRVSGLSKKDEEFFQPEEVSDQVTAKIRVSDLWWRSGGTIDRSRPAPGRNNQILTGSELNAFCGAVPKPTFGCAESFFCLFFFILKRWVRNSFVSVELAQS